MYKKVLLPVSGKKHGERAHQALKHALGLCSGEIILLHVTEPLSQIVGGEAHTELKREEAAKGLTLLCPLIEILGKRRRQLSHPRGRGHPGGNHCARC